jgi:hypothetical protein
VELSFSKMRLVEIYKTSCIFKDLLTVWETERSQENDQEIRQGQLH